MNTGIHWRTIGVLLLALSAARIGAQEPAKTSPDGQTIVVLFSRSMLGGVPDRHALAFTEPMIDLLGRQLGYPVALELAPAKTGNDILALGRSVDAGKTAHIGVLYGMEYGWLLDRCPRLKILVALNAGADEIYRSQILVRPDSPIRDFGGLRGARLALFDRMPLMDLAFLEKRLQEQKSTRESFFGATKTYPRISAAIFAVREKEADCIVVSREAVAQNLNNQPQIKLKPVDTAPFPGAVVVGRPEVVNGLRPKLWEDIREKLQEIHGSAQGHQCVVFWHVQGFARTDQRKFESLAREAAAEYPRTLLDAISPKSRP